VLCETSNRRREGGSKQVTRITSLWLKVRIGIVAMVVGLRVGVDALCATCYTYIYRKYIGENIAYSYTSTTSTEPSYVKNALRHLISKIYFRVVICPHLHSNSNAINEVV